MTRVKAEPMYRLVSFARGPNHIPAIGGIGSAILFPDGPD